MFYADDEELQKMPIKILINAIFRLNKEISVRICVMLVTVLALPIICIFCGRVPTPGEGGKEAVSERVIETAHEAETKNEQSAFPDNDAIREDVYSYYRREPDEEISEEELAAAKGKLSPYSLTIHSGEEFALMREWYDWNTLETYGGTSVVFSEDLKEWTEEQLEALGMLKCKVYVESSGKTIPAGALSYLTGASDLVFSKDSDMTDVSGKMPEGRTFPNQVDGVSLEKYREGKYKTLLSLLQDSKVETICVDSKVDTDSRDSHEVTEELQGFWLDDVAGISALREVNLLNGTAIRARDEKALEGSGVERIWGCADRKTDFCLVGQLPALEELTCDVMEECELRPLLDNAGFSLYLSFYGNCPALYQAVSWPEEVKGEGTRYLYQRRYDQSRIAECFTELPDGMEEGSGFGTERKNPILRITDGAVVYEIKPEENGGVSGGGYVYDLIDEIRFQDINFDGTKDLILDAGRLGELGQWRYEAAYIWNPKTERYEFCPSYRWIDNPAVDTKHRLVRSYWRDWGNADMGSCSWAIYRYVDGEFVMQSMLTQENLFRDEIPDELSVPEEADVIRYQEKIFENGETTEVKNAYAVRIKGEVNVIPSSCEEYYAEDSYWGGT